MKNYYHISKEVSDKVDSLEKRITELEKFNDILKDALREMKSELEKVFPPDKKN